MRTAAMGSSPLARGTHHPHHHSCGDLGLIPARAGNTMCLTSRLRIGWAHPRSRGEHLLDGLPLNVSGGSSPLARGTLRVTVAVGPLEGSSPLARGTRLIHEEGSAGLGLIPARAGNTVRR